MATRKDFDAPEPQYRGGALAPVQAPKPKPRFPCFANGCPMPGTIFEGVIQGHKHTGEFATTEPGTCAWHFGVVPGDIPKVTRALLDWQCVSAEINRARRNLTGDLARDPAGLQREFDAAWQRMRDQVGPWEAELQPGTIRTSKGVDTGHRQSYADWAKHLERFLGARVVEVLSTHQRRQAA